MLPSSGYKTKYRKICFKWIQWLCFWYILSPNSEWSDFWILANFRDVIIFSVLKILLWDTRVNFPVFYSKQNRYARYFSSYARPLKICELGHFGAINGSLVWEFRGSLNWSMVLFVCLAVEQMLFLPLASRWEVTKVTCFRHIDKLFSVIFGSYRIYLWCDVV